MSQTQLNPKFSNQRKLELLSKFEYLVRQLNQHGVDTTSIKHD